MPEALDYRGEQVTRSALGAPPTGAENRFRLLRRIAPKERSARGRFFYFN